MWRGGDRGDPSAGEVRFVTLVWLRRGGVVDGDRARSVALVGKSCAMDTRVTYELGDAIATIVMDDGKVHALSLRMALRRP